MADSTRPQYRYEYAGPVVDLIVTFGTEWSLDFHVGNRGSTEETFVVTMTRSGPGGERFATPAASSPRSKPGDWASASKSIRMWTSSPPGGRGSTRPHANWSPRCTSTLRRHLLTRHPTRSRKRQSRFATSSTSRRTTSPYSN